MWMKLFHYCLELVWINLIDFFSRRYIITMYQMDVSCTSAFFWSSARGSFSCSRLRGTQEARVNTGCNCGPWPRSVARALGVQSGENWETTTGSVSNHLEPRRCHTKPVPRFFYPHEVWWFVSATPHEDSTQHAQYKDDSTPTWHWTRHAQASCSSSSYHAAGLCAALSGRCTAVV